MDLSTRACPIRSETADDKAMTVEARIATDRAVEVMDYDRWEPIDEILFARGCEHPERIPLLNAHQRYDFECVLGSARDLRVAADVTARLHFDGGDEKSRSAYRKAKDGHLTDVSVGYRVLESTTIERGQSGLVGGQTYTASKGKRLRVVTRWKLREVSLVPIGADEMAKIRAAYEAGQGRERAMLPTEGTTPDQTPVSAAPPSAAPALDVRHERESAAAEALRSERERVKSIREIADGIPVATVQQAIDEGWDKARASAEFLAAFRKSASAPVSAAEAPYGFGKAGASEPANRLRALEFGLRHAIGAPVQTLADAVRDHKTAHERGGERHFSRAWGVSDRARGVPGAEPLSAADTSRAAEDGYQYRGLSATDYLREMYEIATGKRAPRAKQGAIDAFRDLLSGREQIRAAGVSIADLQNVFTSSITAQLLLSYELAGDTTVFCRVADVSDFRSQERPRGTAINPMQKLGDGGSVAGLNSANDIVETYRAHRYADMFTFDERAFIDDRLDYLQQIPTMMGQNAAQVRPDLVYYILLNGSSAGLAAGAIFSSGNGNYVASSGALATATLQTAISAMAKQTDTSPSGKARILNIKPMWLVTAQGNRWAALELINSTLVIAGGDTAIGLRGNTNTLAGALEIVSDARFDNGVTDPNSGSAASADADGWALVAGPQYPTIEVGYVRATGRAPVIRPFTLDRGQWGFGWDVKLDVGAKALDYRGLYYSKGA